MRRRAPGAAVAVLACLALVPACAGSGATVVSGARPAAERHGATADPSSRSADQPASGPAVPSNELVEAGQLHDGDAGPDSTLTPSNGPVSSFGSVTSCSLLQGLLDRRQVDESSDELDSGDASFRSEVFVFADAAAARTVLDAFAGDGRTQCTADLTVVQLGATSQGPVAVVDLPAPGEGSAGAAVVATSPSGDTGLVVGLLQVGRTIVLIEGTAPSTPPVAAAQAVTAAVASRLVELGG